MVAILIWMVWRWISKEVRKWVGKWVRRRVRRCVLMILIVTVVIAIALRGGPCCLWPLGISSQVSPRDQHVSSHISLLSSIRSKCLAAPSHCQMRWTCWQLCRNHNVVVTLCQWNEEVLWEGLSIESVCCDWVLRGGVMRGIEYWEGVLWLSVERVSR